ncbi:hypothetical protein BDV19DRAFT_394059 [Aspergillus venezuelensis]
MGVCWIIAVGLAIGHHFYYYSLDGTLVPGQTQQAWSLRVGTGLAFLTKTFLTTAVGIALVQNLWWILRSKPVRLSALDSMWDIRGNIFNFFDPHVWLRGPNVAILGLISWCIPLVTVVTPSTLSVESTLGSIIHQQQMPAIDYTFTRFYTQSNGGPTGPQPSVSRFMTGAVIQGTIPNIPAPAPNASYTFCFHGPYIQCTNSSANISQQVQTWARNNYAHYTAFMGFTPYTDNITHAMEELDSDVYPGPDNGDSDAEIAQKLVMTVWPYFDLDKRWVVECAMHNASYTVDFNFTNGEQDITVTELTVLNRVRDHTQHAMPAPANEDQLFAYTAMFTAFKKVLEGECTGNPPSCDTTQIYSTALANSKQIWDLVYYVQAQSEDGDDDSSSSAPTKSILEIADELARNITVGFYSNPYFLNTTAGPITNITTRPTETRYTYAARNLLIAYGVSVFVSLLCIIAGLLSMWDNGIAFSDSLSTILRATRNRKFDEIVDRESMTGADPGPKALGDTRVIWVGLPSSSHSESAEGSGQVAGLKPLPSLAETEKGRRSGNDESTHPMSPITFSNRIRERKSYRPAAERVESDSNEDVSNSNSTSNLTGFSREGFF